MIFALAYSWVFAPQRCMHVLQIATQWPSTRFGRRKWLHIYSEMSNYTAFSFDRRMAIIYCVYTEHHWTTCQQQTIDNRDANVGLRNSDVIVGILCGYSFWERRTIALQRSKSERERETETVISIFNLFRILDLVFSIQCLCGNYLTIGSVHLTSIDDTIVAQVIWHAYASIAVARNRWWTSWWRWWWCRCRLINIIGVWGFLRWWQVARSAEQFGAGRTLHKRIVGEIELLILGRRCCCIVATFEWWTPAHPPVWRIGGRIAIYFK